MSVSIPAQIVLTGRPVGGALFWEAWVPSSGGFTRLAQGRDVTQVLSDARAYRGSVKSTG